jgi:hypothetical protein
MDSNSVNKWPNGWSESNQKVKLPEEKNRFNANTVDDTSYVVVEKEEQKEDDPTKDLVSETGAPYYNYVKKVPKYIKFRKNANFFDLLYGIEDNISRSSGILITGKESCPKKKDFRIGEKFYFTSGLCGPESSKECVGQPRNIVVDNLPGKKKNNEGLIPSIIGDFGAMEPVELIRSMAGNGVIVNERCSKQDVDITQLNPGGKPYIKTENLCVPDYSIGIKTYVESFKNKNEPDFCDNKENFFLIGLVFVLSALIAYERIN